MEKESSQVDIKSDVKLFGADTKPDNRALKTKLKEEPLSDFDLKHKADGHCCIDESKEKLALDTNFAPTKQAPFFCDIKQEIKAEPEDQQIVDSMNLEDKNLFYQPEVARQTCGSISNFNLKLKANLKDLQADRGSSFVKLVTAVADLRTPVAVAEKDKNISLAVHTQATACEGEELEESKQSYRIGMEKFSERHSKEMVCMAFQQSGLSFQEQDRSRSFIGHLWRKNSSSKNNTKRPFHVDINVHCQTKIPDENIDPHSSQKSKQPARRLCEGGMQSHSPHSFPLYRCDECNRSFSALINLSLHLKVHSQQGSLNWDVCGKSYTEKSFFEKHALSHQIWFKCDMCNKTFSKKGTFKLHLKKHISNADFKCTICGKCFQMKSGLENHKSVHSNCKPYSCDICQAKFKLKYSMILHIKNHLGIRPHKCDVCDKTFFLAKGLNRHKKLHPDALNWEEYSKLYKCLVCGKIYPRKRGLLAHEISKHSEENRPFKCNVCPERFKKRGTLVNHEKLHSRIETGGNVYLCKICGRLFPRKYALQKHSSVHSEERKFQCGVCGKCYKRKDSLLAHEQNKHART